MRVALKKIKLTNWRGAESLTVEFNHGETVISGTNGTFKSTLAEAYRWGITGKDTLDRKDYDLKNTVKTHLNRGDHEVCIILDVAGQEKELVRSYREIWVRQRGKEKEERKGNETAFFINNVPFNAGQFAEVVKGWFSDVQFKVLTDPLFFNTPNGEKWKWTHMRDILVSMAGEIDREEVYSKAEIFGDRRKTLDEAIKTWCALDKLKKEVAEKKKKANDELRGIPESIESQERTKPELQNWVELGVGIEALEAALEQVNAEIAEASKGDQAVEMRKQEVSNLIREKKNVINNYKEEISNGFRQKNRDRADKIATKEQELRDAERIIVSRQRDVEGHEKDVARFEVEKARMLVVYNAELAKELPDMDPKELKCPMCERLYDADKIDNARKLFTENWNDTHAKAIEKIKTDGSAIKKNIAESQSAVENEKTKLEEARAHKLKLESELEVLKALPEYKQSDLEEVLKDDGWFQEQHAELRLQEEILDGLNNPTDADGEREKVLLKLRSEKDGYTLEKLRLQNLLATKSQYERVIAEIERLQQKQVAAGQAIAELEGIEFAIDGYNKARNEVVALRVNRMFPEGIEYKLFDELNDGTTVEFCELYLNGKPWGTLNTGGKINAGLQCINTFQDHWDMYLPVWIDNRESTVSIPGMLSQVINLIVDPSKEKLSIS